MKLSGYRCTLRRSVVNASIGFALSMFVMTPLAFESETSDTVDLAEQNLAVGLTVSGASVGITTEYFEQTVTDAMVSQGVFDSIENTKTDEFVMSMNNAKGAFRGVRETDDVPYVLKIRIIKIETPSFSTRMTVGMNVVWELSRGDEKAALLQENIRSTYTGGVFEGGLIGANRVRAAIEGATRENIRIGMEKLAALNLHQD